NAFPADITGNRRIIAFPGDLVDLIDVYDSPFGRRHVVVADLQQPGKDAFHILSDITGFSKDGRIDNGKGNIEQPRNRLCQEGLTRPGFTDHDDIALFYFDVVLDDLLLKTFVMIVNGYR